jgi:hypothetical protein
LERNKLYARGKARFKRDYQTVNHIFIIFVIIEEAKQHFSKVFAGSRIFERFLIRCQVTLCFRGFEMLESPLITTIMKLYEVVICRLHSSHSLSNFIRSTIGVKHGCPLSMNLFNVYIDELEAHLREHTCK